MLAADLRIDAHGAQHFAAAVDEDALLRIEGVWSRDDRPGDRLYDIRAIADLVGLGGPVGCVAAELQGSATRPVRALLFDKRADLNWSLGLHQDRTIAVRERRETEGYGRWSIKAGQLHVQPPAELMARMITLRIHLDDVDADVAPLTILLCTHCLGRLDDQRITALAETAEAFDCHACRGDIWAYATAIVHGSRSVRISGRRRRVLQIDYAAEELPHGLRWAMHA